MLKGLAITPPVLGRISIGKVIEKNGKRLPEKDDQFTITSQLQRAVFRWRNWDGYRPQVMRKQSWRYCAISHHCWPSSAYWQIA